MRTAAHSDDLRSRVVAEILAGASRRQAAERFKVSAASAVRWAQLHSQTGGVMVWTAPYGIECARKRLLRSQTREPSVNQISRIGMDTSKHIFQLHGVDAAEQPVLRRRLRRKEMVAFFAKLPPTVIGMEACGASHYWARELGQIGHTVKLIAPQHVKPYIKRNKNDGRDAEGLCEAMSRPTMQFVPVKTEEQQAALMLAGMRERLVARRTQLSNAIRGYAAEVGVTAAKGLDKIEPLLAEIAADEALPELARELFAIDSQGRAGRAPLRGLVWEP